MSIFEQEQTKKVKQWSQMSLKVNTIERIKEICPGDISYSDLLDEMLTHKLFIRMSINKVRRTKITEFNKKFNDAF